MNDQDYDPYFGIEFLSSEWWGEYMGYHYWEMALSFAKEMKMGQVDGSLEWLFTAESIMAEREFNRRGK